MSMIDRYKKKGGFVQLLNLIETMGKEKQEKFLKMIADETPIWESEIRGRMLSMDKILAWPSEYLAEVFPRMQAIQLGMIIGGLTAEKAAHFSKTLGFKEKRQIDELLKEKQPTPAETSGGIMKLFSEIRKMEAEGLLRFEKFAPELVIAQDIEEQLGKGIRSQGSGQDPIPTQIQDPVQALAPSSVGKVAEFNLAPPPPGLPPNIAEELTGLRRKLVQLTQENQKLQQDNSQMKEKLQQIRKIA